MFSNDQFLTRYATAAGITPFNRSTVATALMRSHQAEIVDYLQVLWDQASTTGVTPFPTTAIPTATPLSFAVLTYPSSAAGPSAWFHLIYAYLLENTRIYELFGRVIDRFSEGESLGVASPDTRQWLSTTEALFYRQQAAHDHFPLTTLTSDTRADGRAIRRNAYYRMFGMDLNHGTAENKPYPYPKPKISNRDVFVWAFESLLRELWVAIVNQSTTTANQTDAGAIADLSRRLSVMLNDRRTNGTLNAEEFSAVATLDWLRLAVSFDSPVVGDLRANAASEAERLLKIADRVGLPAHGKSDEYFHLAAPTATLLRGIELGLLQQVTQYLTPAVQPMVATIITHWSSATGRALKAKPVAADAA